MGHRWDEAFHKNQHQLFGIHRPHPFTSKEDKPPSSLQNPRQPTINTMQLESTSSRLYTASCFEDNDHTEHSTGESMKQPLISMGNESLKDEEQTKLSKESASRSIIICKSFFLGSSIGFASQVFRFAACCALATITPASLLSSCPYLQDCILAATWLTTIYATTKFVSLYVRKTFGKEDASRMLFVHFLGSCFLVGAFVGSVSLWMIVAWHLGMAIPWMPLFRGMITDTGFHFSSRSNVLI
jgi:hypothetical protein